VLLVSKETYHKAKETSVTRHTRPTNTSIPEVSTSVKSDRTWQKRPAKETRGTPTPNPHPHPHLHLTRQPHAAHPHPTHTHTRTYTSPDNLTRLDGVHYIRGTRRHDETTAHICRGSDHLTHQYLREHILCHIQYLREHILCHNNLTHQYRAPQCRPDWLRRH